MLSSWAGKIRHTRTPGCKTNQTRNATGQCAAAVTRTPTTTGMALPTPAAPTVAICMIVPVTSRPEAPAASAALVAVVSTAGSSGTLGGNPCNGQQRTRPCTNARPYRPAPIELSGCPYAPFGQVILHMVAPGVLNPGNFGTRLICHVLALLYRIFRHPGEISVARFLVP